MMFGVTRGGRARVMRFGISVSSSETATKRGGGPLRRSHHADRRWIAAIADGLLMEAALHGALQPHAAPRAARPRNERASRPNAEPPHPLLSLPRWDRAHRVAGPPVATTIANGALAPAADVSAS